MRGISVIIPVLNDNNALDRLLKHLSQCQNREFFEIIIVDGGSKETPRLPECDNTRLIRSGKAGRAIQMNRGASIAQNDLLYFIHADALPPFSFVKDINRAVSKRNEVGGFRLKMVSGPLLLHVNSFITRFITPFSGGGDQSLYITRDRFFSENGFNEKYSIMEDFEFVNRLRPQTGYYIIPKDILVSSRKYKNNNFFKVNIANYRAFKLFKKGEDPDVIKQKYHSWLDHINRENG